MGLTSRNGGVENIINEHWWDGQANGQPGTFTGGDGYLIEANSDEARAPLITFRSVIASDHIAEFIPWVTSFSDTWSSDWSSEHVFGRSDPIYTWKSTGRNIALGFKVIAGSYREAYINMCNVSKLTRMLYPYYAEGRESLATAVGKAPLVRIRWGNLIMNSQDASWTGGMGGDEANYMNGLLGVIKSVSVTPDFEEGMIEGPGPSSYYPKLWNIAVDFGVLHENILGWTGNYEMADHDTVDEDSRVGGDGMYNRADGYGWIPETPPLGADSDGTANTGYPYGIKSTGCQSYSYSLLNAPDEGLAISAEGTGASPDTDAGILEQEIRQQQLTNFYTRGDERPASDYDFGETDRDRSLEPGPRHLTRTAYTPVARPIGNLGSPGSRGQGGY
jgi:hypothetical protein